MSISGAGPLIRTGSFGSCCKLVIDLALGAGGTQIARCCRSPGLHAVPRRQQPVIPAARTRLRIEKSGYPGTDRTAHDLLNDRDRIIIVGNAGYAVSEKLNRLPFANVIPIAFDLDHHLIVLIERWIH